MAKDVNKATEKLKKGLAKFRKLSQSVSGRPGGGAEKRFDDLQKDVK